MASSASEMQVASVCLVAIPMALVFATVARKAARQNTPLGLAPAAIFVIGHIAIWGLSARGPRSSSGVMNLLQIAAITVFVLLEKVLLFGERGCRVMGPLMVFAGLLALVGVGWN